MIMISAKIDKIDTKIDKIDTKIDKIDTKIDQIETDCQDPGYFLQWPYIETAHSINATFAPELIASGIL